MYFLSQNLPYLRKYFIRVTVIYFMMFKFNKAIIKAIIVMRLVFVEKTIALKAKGLDFIMVILMIILS